MKKIITSVLTALFLTTSANAFFNTAWNDNTNGNYDDNGIFAYNSFDYWDPRWYSTEFTNFVNELDDEFEVTDHAVTAGSPYNFPTEEK